MSMKKTIKKMLITVRTARFLILFVLVAGSLSTAGYFIQVGDCYAADECNLVFSERKAMQSIENKMRGGKMKEISNERLSKYTRKLRMVMPRENYDARFVAVNADYKGPRHHPPKNN